MFAVVTTTALNSGGLLDRRHVVWWEDQASQPQGMQRTQCGEEQVDGEQALTSDSPALDPSFMHTELEESDADASS